MKLPILKGTDLVNFLNKIGFISVRQKGSHIRLRHQDNRVTTVPIHKGKDIPKGLLTKIIKEDLKISIEEFIELFQKK